MNIIKKIFSNLALDFGLLLFLAILVTILSLFGIQRVASDYQRVVNYSFEIERLAAKIEIDVLLANNLEETFFIQLEHEGFEAAYENYIVPHEKYTDDLQQDIIHLTNLVNQHVVLGDETILEDLNKIHEAVEVYEETFAYLLTHVEKRGTLKSGIEGTFRARAALIGDLLGVHTEYPELVIALLTMQVHEDEYLITRSSELAGKAIIAYHELVDLVEQSKLPGQKKTEIAFELEFYDQEFLDVVEIDIKIAQRREEVREAVKTIIRLAEKIDQTARQAIKHDTERAHKTTNRTRQLVILSVIIVSIFGLGLIIAIAYQLRHQN